MLPYYSLLISGALALVLGPVEPEPFKIAVDPRLIEEATNKARLYRPSLDLEDGTSGNWLEGPPAANMTALAKYWAEDYDWAKFQEELNANHSHYYTTVPGGQGYDHPVPLHFIHQRSQRKDAIPLLFLHGWPSTHYEWSQVIHPLVTPTNNETVSFHAVVPDFPGFGFSPAPTHEGFGSRQAGAVLGNLMKALGYEKYGIVTTDAGWYVGLWMAVDQEEQLIGHFTDFYPAVPSPADLDRFSRNLTDLGETRYITSTLGFQRDFASYMAIQSQSPQKLGQAMTDSPVGYAGWIWHHMQFCSDGYPYSWKEVIDRTLLLWIPGAYGNLRTYKEWLKPENTAFLKSRVPTGVSQWGSVNGGSEVLQFYPLAPRSWIERLSNLTFLVTRDFGGHFPAEHHPDIYTQDVQTFFGSLTLAK